MEAGIVLSEREKKGYASVSIRKFYKLLEKFNQKNYKIVIFYIKSWIFLAKNYKYLRILCVIDIPKVKISSFKIT